MAHRAKDDPESGASSVHDLLLDNTGSMTASRPNSITASRRESFSRWPSTIDEPMELLTPLRVSSFASTVGDKPALADLQLDATAMFLSELGPDLETLVEPDSSHDTFWPCVLNLVKVITGAGMMALPYAFAMVGAVAGTVLLVTVALITYLTGEALVLASDSVAKRSYGDVVSAQLGRAARVVLQLALIVNCLGLLVVYMVVMGDVLVGDPGRANGVLCELVGGDACFTWLLLDRRVVLSLLMVLLLMPVASVRSLGALRPLNTVGVAAVGAFVACTVGLYAAAAWHGRALPVPLWPNWKALGDDGWSRVTRAMSVVPVLLNCDVCQQSIHALMPCLYPYTQRRMCRVLGSSVALCNAMYWAVAIACVGVFGLGVDADVLNDLSSDVFAPYLGGSMHLAFAIACGVRLAFLVALVGSFALMLWPLRDTLLEMMLPNEAYAGELNIWAFYSITFSLMVGVLGAAVGVPSIWEVMAFTGATASTSIAFIFPALIIILTAPSSNSGEGSVVLRLLIHVTYVSVGVLILAIGAVLFVNGFMPFFN